MPRASQYCRKVTTFTKSELSGEIQVHSQRLKERVDLDLNRLRRRLATLGDAASYLGSEIHQGRDVTARSEQSAIASTASQVIRIYLSFD